LSIYRPWGNVLWLLDKLKIEDWVTLGCIATESRSCTSVANYKDFSSSFVLLKITDPQPLESEAVANAYDDSESQLDSIPEDQKNVIESELMATLDDLEDYVELCVEKSPNVIIDITSFPKRWFFPFIQMLINDVRILNLVAVYTQGETYAATIAENPEPLRPLPGFITADERSSHDHAFVGVGFHDLGMLKLLGDDSVKKLNLMFPFPPGPPGNKKNWKFVEQINRKIGGDISSEEFSEPLSLHFLPALDASEAFTAMSNITRKGQLTSIMAPYGPKPISLAMCMFAIAVDNAGLEDVPVYYSQPQRYAVEYTKNALKSDDGLESWAYALKLNGRDLYTI